MKRCVSWWSFHTNTRMIPFSILTVAIILRSVSTSLFVFQLPSHCNDISVVSLPGVYSGIPQSNECTKPLSVVCSHVHCARHASTWIADCGLLSFFSYFSHHNNTARISYDHHNNNRPATAAADGAQWRFHINARIIEKRSTAFFMLFPHRVICNSRHGMKFVLLFSLIHFFRVFCHKMFYGNTSETTNTECVRLYYPSNT